MESYFKEKDPKALEFLEKALPAPVKKIKGSWGK
jgi:hypothetical protein